MIGDSGGPARIVSCQLLTVRFDPEIREVQRLEVITGALGRRRWGAEAKARILAEGLVPGVVISEVVRRHDLRPQQLFAWRHQARQGRLALPAAELSFVPVVGGPDARLQTRRHPRLRRSSRSRSVVSSCESRPRSMAGCWPTGLVATNT